MLKGRSLRVFESESGKLIQSDKLIPNLLKTTLCTLVCATLISFCCTNFAAPDSSEDKYNEKNEAKVQHFGNYPGANNCSICNSISLEYQINLKMASGRNSRLDKPKWDPHGLVITSLFGSQGSQRHEPSQEVHILNHFHQAMYVLKLLTMHEYIYIYD